MARRRYMGPMLLILALACKGSTPEPADSGDTPLFQAECREGQILPGPTTVVVSHPYTAGGGQARGWEILSVQDGVFSETGITFEMGRGLGGPVVFAPNGSLGVAVQDDGSLGIFTPEGEVVEAAWNPGFYASHVAFDALGERLFVVDGNWENNGGGIYEVTLDCETGAPTLVGKLLGSKLGAWLFGDTYVFDAQIATVDLAAGTVGEPMALFDDEDAIVGGADWLRDRVYVGNNSAFSLAPNTVAVLQPTEAGFERLAEVQVLDPYAIVAVQGGAIVSSGFGDEIVAVGARGILDTLRSELPGALAGVPAGGVLVAEVSGIRMVRLERDALVDLAFYETPGLERMVGSMGTVFQPDRED